MPANIFASQINVLVIAGMVCLLAAANGWATPDKWIAWTGAVILTLIGLGLMVGVRKSGPAACRNLYRSLCAGGLIICLALGFSLGETLNLIPETASKRTVGILIGLILAISGNYLPKAVIPLSTRTGDAARALRAERFTGRVLTLAGLIFAAIWVLAPIGSAPVGSALVGMAALALALIAWLWLHTGTSQQQPQNKE